jgi:hypothetical protein
MSAALLEFWLRAPTEPTPKLQPRQTEEVREHHQERPRDLRGRDHGRQ